MKLTKEPKEVDLLIKSEPWSEQDLVDFRALMEKIKSRNKSREIAKSTKPIKPTNPVKNV